jgi:hypothetical protein
MDCIQLCGLTPLRPHSDQTADSTGNAHKTVIEGGKTKRRDGNGQVAQVGDQLDTGGGTLPDSRQYTMIIKQY